MSDVFSSEQAKRLYGLIAAGGSAGAIAGPLATVLLVGRVGLVPMLVAAAILLELCVLCVAGLVRWSRSARPGSLSGHAEERIGGSAFAGFALTMRSPYLLAIAGQIVLYSLVSTILYFEQARLVGSALPDPVARTALFAKLDLAINVMNIIVEVFATGWILSRVGLVAALVALPVLSIVGSFALAASTTLPVLIAVGVARRVAHFSVDRPAREVLYTAVGSEEKYKAKSFIDTMVYRGSDAAAGWLHSGLAATGVAASATAFGMAPLAALAIPLGVYLARRHRERADVQGAAA
jgi:AAA family ATP:ADP antiporter